MIKKIKKQLIQCPYKKSNLKQETKHLSVYLLLYSYSNRTLNIYKEIDKD